MRYGWLVAIYTISSAFRSENAGMYLTLFFLSWRPGPAGRPVLALLILLPRDLGQLLWMYPSSILMHRYQGQLVILAYCPLTTLSLLFKRYFLNELTSDSVSRAFLNHLHINRVSERPFYHKKYRLLHEVAHALSN